MSLASDYAAAQAAIIANQATVTAAAPPSFIGPNGRAEVTSKGNLHFVQTASGDLELPAAAALIFADWINATFR